MNANRFYGMDRDAAVNFWRDEAKRVHPDKHPATESEHWTEEFKALNHEYAEFAAGNARQQAYDRQTAAHSEGRKSQADYVNVDDLYGEWRRVVEAALNLGVDAEIIGLWIWVSGPNTYAAREQLKELGFKWAKKKEDKTLYFNDMGVKSFGRGWTMEEIRNAHGSQKVNNPYRKNNKPQDEETNEPAAIPATV